MDSFFARFRNPLTLMAIVLVQVLALAIQVQKPAANAVSAAPGESHRVTLLRHWALAVVTPFERLTHGISSRVRYVWDDYIDLRHQRADDKQLRDEIARLRIEQAQFAEDAREGRRLQALLAFKEQYVATTVAAQVIGTSGTDRSRTLTLDKGWDDGLRPEQAVMTPDGVVGKLRDVSKHTAQLLLLNDVTSGAGVVLASTRIRGILRGASNGAIDITNLTADSRIKPGEQVITSGGDMVFPRGLAVGVIESIVPDPQHQPYTRIAVKPSANLMRLEEVLVITGTKDTLPLAAQGDLAVADATAEANKRAADVVADKLPGLKPEDKADDAPATAADPKAALPKPKPVVHPDKYSPNAAPAATELQPGAPAAPDAGGGAKP